MALGALIHLTFINRHAINISDNMQKFYFLLMIYRQTSKCFCLGITVTFLLPKAYILITFETLAENIVMSYNFGIILTRAKILRQKTNF